MNEALLEYYHHLQEGLVSVFIQSKIVTGKYKIDCSTPLSSVLKLAGEAIPEVGGVLSGLGSALEFKNERDIKAKLLKINHLIRDDKKNLIAKYIAAKITIKRRNYIAGLTEQEIRSSVNSFEKLTVLFDDKNVYKLKASIDLKIIEVYILALDVKKIQLLYTKENFAETFSAIIVKEFMGDVKSKQIDEPLKQGEMPYELILDKKFMVAPEFFSHPKYPLPMILKKLAGESELVH
jgi:hypothetical protein